MSAHAAIVATREFFLEPVPRPMFAAGRVCAHDGCDTVLAVYHEGEFCYRHEPEPALADVIQSLIGRDNRTRLLDHENHTKLCPACRETKPLTTEHWYYSKRKSRPGAQWSHLCKPCSSAKAVADKQARVARQRGTAA